MGGSFACPECGNSLELKGLTPGRQIRCGWCRTWVEVPFLPRAGGRARGVPPRSRRPKWVSRAWTGLALLAFVLIALGTSRMFQSHSRQVHEQALNRLTQAARDDERAGRFGPALATIEGALVEAARITPRNERRLAELKGWRDRVAHREIEARLTEFAGMDPERAVGACLTLLARIHADPGLACFEEPVAEQCDRARERLVEADLKSARLAFESSDAARVIDLCERLVDTANTLETETRRRARAEADALVAQVITRRGLVVGTIDGQFVLGSEASYARMLQTRLVETLRRQGYVPRPSSSFWQSLWDRLAPFHLRVGVVETLPGPYMQSPNRTSAIDLTLVLQEKGKPSAIWERSINAQTRIPLRGLPALQASRLAVSDHRDPAVEHFLYEDARSLLVERLSMRLRSLPETQSPLVPPSESAGGS